MYEVALDAQEQLDNYMERRLKKKEENHIIWKCDVQNMMAVDNFK